MRGDWTTCLFYANLAAHFALLLGAVGSVAFPTRRVYPMPGRNVWFYGMWTLFLVVFTSNAIFLVTDWNTGLWISALRYCVAVPILALGTGLLLWGMVTLGLKNTAALPDGLVARGPYLISRNPQYVGDFLIFLGLTTAANSRLLLVTHILTSLVFIVATIAEESWLETEHVNDYADYRARVPRFL